MSSFLKEWEMWEKKKGAGSGSGSHSMPMLYLWVPTEGVYQWSHCLDLSKSWLSSLTVFLFLARPALCLDQLHRRFQCLQLQLLLLLEDHLTWTIQISMSRGTCERVAPEGRPHWQFLVSSATSLDHRLDPSTRFSPVSLPFILNFPEQRPWCRVTKSSGICLHFLLLSHSSGGPCILLKTCKNMNSGSLEWVLSQAEGNFVATFIKGVVLQIPMSGLASTTSRVWVCCLLLIFRWNGRGRSEMQ